MYGIKINNQYLHLNPDNSLVYEINSQLNFGSDIDTLKNGLVYSFTVPNSDHNAETLGHPSDIQRRGNFLKDKECEIVADGTSIFQGLLTVVNATAKQISISIKIGTIPGLTTTDLPNVLPTNYTDNTKTPLQLMKDSAVNPFNHPFICFPVYNSELNIGGAETLISATMAQNFYDIGTDEFVNNSPQTPFLRLDYLLEKLFNHFGYGFKNEWQLTDELKRLTLYNNYDHRVAGAAVNFFNLQYMVPNVKVSDFLKKLCRLFNLAYEVDIVNKTARLFPLSDVIQTGAMTDWSGKMIADTVQYKQDREAITQLRYENPNAYTGRAAYTTDYYDSVLYQTDNAETLTISDPNGFYYDRRRDAVYQWLTPTATLKNKSFDRLKIADGTAWESTMLAVINEVLVFECSITVTMPSASRTLYVPYVRIKMSDTETKNDFPLMLMPYRGFQNCLEDTIFPPPTPSTAPPKNYPFASSNVWNVRRNNQNGDTHSLYFNDANGLGIRSGLTDLLNLINTKTDVECDLLLTPADLQAFKPTKKIRIDNMEYFVKKLTGVIRGKSISRVKAELITTV